MKNYCVIFMEPAEEGLLEIAEYIALDNPAKAVSFIDELTGSLKKTLSIFPYSGKAYLDIEADDIRIFPYGNYVGYYRVKEDELLIEVLFIFNAKQKVSELIQSI